MACYTKYQIFVSACVSDLEAEGDSDSPVEFNVVMVESSLLSDSQVSDLTDTTSFFFASSSYDPREPEFSYAHEISSDSSVLDMFSMGSFKLWQIACSLASTADGNTEFPVQGGKEFASRWRLR
jgi:hypothetical protein